MLGGGQSSLFADEVPEGDPLLEGEALVALLVPVEPLGPLLSPKAVEGGLAELLLPKF